MGVVYDPVKLEIIPGQTVLVVQVSQYDIGDTIVFELYKRGVPYSVPSGYSVKAQGTKRNGLGYTTACTYSGNVVYLPVTRDMTSYFGPVPSELVIYNGTSNVHGTMNFGLLVEISPHDPGVLDGSADAVLTQMRAWYESTEDFYELAHEDAISARHNAEEAKEFRDEAAAIVTPGGLADLVLANSDRLHCLYFDTVAAMKACITIKDGEYCITAGYYAKNDGGGTYYKISESIPTGYYETLTNGLYAEMVTLNYVTPEMFGAHGNGGALSPIDDTTAVQTAIDYAFDNQKKIIFSTSKIYAVTSILIGNAIQSIDFCGCTLLGLSAEVDGVVVVRRRTDILTQPHGYVKNLVIDMGGKAPNGLYVNGARRRIFDAIYVINPPANGNGIRVASGNGCLFNNIRFRSQQDNPALGTIGILIDADDNTYSNIDFINFVTGIKSNGFAVFSNIHGFINQASIYPTSVFMDLGASCQCSNLYPDTQRIALKMSARDVTAMISNLVLVFNEGLIGTSIVNEYPPYFMDVETYFARRIVINGLSVNNIRYDIDHIMNDSASFALEINGMRTGSQNAGYSTLTDIGFAATYVNPFCTFESARRTGGYPCCFKKGYIDTITVSGHDIAESSTIVRFTKSRIMAPRNGYYSCVIKTPNGELRQAILSVTSEDNNVYINVLGGVLNGEIIYVNIPTRQYFVTQQT